MNQQCRCETRIQHTIRTHITYKCDPSEKWLVLIGIAPGSPEKPQLGKGNMHLFSVYQQRSQALEAHAASFASFKVSGNVNPSILIYFATKSSNAGQVTSKLHVIELVAQPGKAVFTKKQADLFFPPDFADDFPVAMQISHKYGLIYVITKLGLLFVYDLETATAVYGNRISPYPIFLTSEASSVGGFYAVNRRGRVLLATLNEATIVPFVSGQLNNLELAVNLAKRGNLPGVENLVVQRFQELVAQTKYKEAAELAAESPQGILRTPDTVGISANEYSEKESKRSSKHFLGSSRRDEVAVEVDNGSNEATARLISEGNRENTASSGQTPWDEGERKSVVYEQRPVVQVQPLVQLSQKPAKTETKGNGEIHQPKICRTFSVANGFDGAQEAAGWPSWLTAVAGEAIKGWLLRRADSFDKLDKIGQGTYSSVYRSRDIETGKIVSLKKVRFTKMDP
uniref:Protein kinase domain-containing protein n=1 Tax=Lactuca sativa TaxID=4236 RepID=A0A9R1VE30_LACSA|nr:hypothetical protein LSAT_V11C500296050 [Lactuca sativa]